MNEPRRRLKGAQRREMIVDAARALLSERAYDNVSIGDIAAKAGVSRTVLYDHFTSKQAVLESFLFDEITALVTVIGDAVGREGTQRERLVGVIEAFFEFIQTRPLAFRILALDSRTEPEIAAIGRAIRVQSNQAIADMLAADSERAALSATAREVSVVALTSAVEGVHEWWLEHPDVPAAEVADALTNVFWNGFKGWTND